MASTIRKSKCKRVVVKVDDKRYDLGSPSSPLFRLKLWHYMLVSYLPRWIKQKREARKNG